MLNLIFSRTLLLHVGGTQAPRWGAIEVPRKKGGEAMIILVYQDWFGTEEELKEWDDAVKAACAKVDV